MTSTATRRVGRPAVAGPGDAFRRVRVDAGWTQQGLAKAAGLSGAYVAQLERGNIANPSSDARTRIASVLDVDVAVAFADFPDDEIAARRARELELYKAGRSHKEIASLVGVSPSVVRADLHAAAEYTPRPTRSTYKPPAGCTLASRAAAARELDVWTLCETIKRDEIPGAFTVKVAEGLVYVVHEQQLDDYLANRPECEHEGCTQRALVGSRACCGGHASGLATAGTKKSYETRTKMSIGKKGKPRPDTRERIRAVFADPETGHEMRLKMQQGRRLVRPATIAQRENALSGVRHGRKAAAKARAHGTRPGPKFKYTDEQRAEVLALRERNPKLGEREIAKRVEGISYKQVRGILAAATAAP